MSVPEGTALGDAVARIGARTSAAFSDEPYARVLRGHYARISVSNLVETVRWVDHKYTAYATWKGPKGFDHIEQVCDTWQEANELLPVLANMLRARA